MATGVVSWSQSQASNATADANINFAEGMAPSQVDDSCRAIMSSVAKWRDDMAGTLLSSGTSTAFTVISNQGFGTLAALSGQTVVVRFAATNGAAPTLNVDSLGGKAINVDANTAVATGAVRANSIHHLTYDNSLGLFILHGGHSLVEPGRIATHGSSTPPPGWLNCDGTGYSRTTQADLFAAISTTYGSSDGVSFKVPDLRVKIAIGIDPSNSIGQGAITLASTGGEYLHTLTQGEMPSHTHTDTGHTHGVSGGSFVTSAAGSQYNATGAGAGNVQANTASGTANLSNTGGGGSHNNVQPYIAINYIIKT